MGKHVQILQTVKKVQTKQNHTIRLFLLLCVLLLVLYNRLWLFSVVNSTLFLSTQKNTKTLTTTIEPPQVQIHPSSALSQIICWMQTTEENWSERCTYHSPGIPSNHSRAQQDKGDMYSTDSITWRRPAVCNKNLTTHIWSDNIVRQTNISFHWSITIDCKHMENHMWTADKEMNIETIITVMNIT